jgi:hypothetical protein
VAAELPALNEVLHRRLDELEELRVTKPEDVVPGWIDAQLGKLIDAYRAGLAAGRIRGAGLLRTALAKGTMIESDDPQEAAGTDDRRGLVRDQYSDLIHECEWQEDGSALPAGEIVRAILALQDAGEQVTLAAIRLKIGPVACDGRDVDERPRLRRAA